jgi:hypothetical protein
MSRFRRRKWGRIVREMGEKKKEKSAKLIKEKKETQTAIWKY